MTDHPTLRRDRAATWLDALPDYRQGRGALARRHRDGTVTWCLYGAACDTARAAGYPGFTVTPAEGDRKVPRAWEHYGALSAWLGFDTVGLRVHFDQLPPWLADRIAAHLVTDRRQRPFMVEFDEIEQVGRRGHCAWSLSDALVPFELLADALRVVLDVDAHRVPGTAAHNLCVLQEALEAVPWGDGTPEASEALSVARAR